MRTILLTFLILLFFQDAGSQPVTVSGSAPGAEGLTIRIIGWRDLITFTEEIMAETTIDSTGRFSMQFDLAYTSVFAIAIDLHKSQLYLQPGKSYQLMIAEINYTDNLEVNPFIPAENLDVELINPGDNELNIWINAYDDKVNQFLLDYFNFLYLERKKTYIDTLVFQVNAWYHHVDLPYFQDYIRYKTAALEQVARAAGMPALAREYFIDKPILYHNVAYMKFFNNYFTRYLTTTSDFLRKIDLVPVIKGVNPYKGLMKTLLADTLLRNDELRELVLLNGLFELFYAGPDLQEHIIGIFQVMRTDSPFEEIRIVADDMYRKVTKLRKGTKAPVYSLRGRENEKNVSLDAFRGKPVVLNFWTTFCEGCLAEMEQQVPLVEKYREQVNFISICADKPWIKMVYFIDMKPEFDWTMLHYSGNTDLLTDYDVKTYPLYVVIDKEGNIFAYPAPHPGDGLEAVIQEVIRY